MTEASVDPRVPHERAGLLPSDSDWPLKATSVTLSGLKTCSLLGSSPLSLSDQAVGGDKARSEQTFSEGGGIVPSLLGIPQCPVPISGLDTN